MIRYSATILRCKCQCGETFYADGGNQVQRAVCIHDVVVTCPRCSKEEFLHSGYMRKTITRSPRFYLKNIKNLGICKCDQHAQRVQELVHEAVLTRSHLSSLMGVTLAAVTAWRKDWWNLFMTEEFSDMERCIKEINE